ncbi:hypothetical protein JN080_14805 [Bacillus sp. EB600]|nr:hypothetical protein [Bacillus sp. EB600]MCQ6280509.1 hypothetical protein [Bacillus sp. EB600]
MEKLEGRSKRKSLSKHKGFKIVVYKDAVASFNQKGHEWVLEHFHSHWI